MNMLKTLGISLLLTGLVLIAKPILVYANEYDDALSHFSYLPWSPQRMKEEKWSLAFLRAITAGNRKELEAKYDIEGNASLDDAQIVLFSEDHDSREIISTNYKLLAKLLRPGDVVLFERKAVHMDVIVTAAWKMGYFGASLSPEDLAAFRPEDMPFLGVNGTGWDLHEPSSARLFCNVHHSYDRFMLHRNAPFEKIFDKLKCRRIFVISGALHLPSTYTVKKGGLETSLNAMRKTLAHYPHAILTMKNFEAVGYPEIQRNRLVLGTVVAAVLFKTLPVKIAIPVLVALYAGFQTFIGHVVAIAIEKDLIAGCIRKGLTAEGPTYADVYESQRAAEDAATVHLDAYCPKSA